MGPINGPNLRRPERTEAGDAMRQRFPENQQAILKKEVDLLVHATTCVSEGCGWEGCPAFKDQLHHFRNCLKAPNDLCNPCRYDVEAMNTSSAMPSGV
jgi:hypothetical protein